MSTQDTGAGSRPRPPMVFPGLVSMIWKSPVILYLGPDTVLLAALASLAPQPGLDDRPKFYVEKGAAHWATVSEGQTEETKALVQRDFAILEAGLANPVRMHSTYQGFRVRLQMTLAVMEVRDLIRSAILQPAPALSGPSRTAPPQRSAPSDDTEDTPEALLARMEVLQHGLERALQQPLDARADRTPAQRGHHELVRRIEALSARLDALAAQHRDEHNNNAGLDALAAAQQSAERGDDEGQGEEHEDNPAP